MIQATDVNVITAGDGTKALAVDLVLIVPLNPDFILELVEGLLAAPEQETTDTSTTEQDSITEAA